MFQIIIILLTFLALAAVVDNFLIPAVYQFKDRFRWTDDQTGTIISFVSSAPELSVSAVALILAAVSGNVQSASMGPGTVIGSALFSILFIVGASAWFTTKKLSWPAVIRDMFYYLLSVATVYLVVIDSKIEIWEPFLLLVVFILYSLIVAKWKSVLLWLSKNINSNIYDEEVEISKELAQELSVVEEEKLHIKDQKWTSSNFISKTLAFAYFDLKDKKSAIFKVIWNIVLSVALIIFFSTLMVNNAESWARILGISPVVISLTILAVGTSIPDLLASIKTAREGFGDTAIANAVGSNIFDILANLGLTWSVAVLIGGGRSLTVDTNNLQTSIILLIAATISLILVMIAKRFHLSKPISLLLMFSYILYISWEVWKVIN